MAHTARSAARWIALSAIPLTFAAAVAVNRWSAERTVPAAPPRIHQAQLPFSIPTPELPPSEPSSEVPTLVAVSQQKVDVRAKALAGELSKMWTSNPEELVDVIDHASRSAAVSPSVTLLLAIAHAETNGKILDVSEAGAVGLAQATPVAIRQEALEGKMFVTADYLLGARAYIMKKPLGDADTIASLIVAKDDSKTRKRAKRLLQSALSLRREGVDELELLRPFGSKRYFAGIESADQHNLHALKQLGKLIDHGSRRELRAYRDQVRHEYRTLKQMQLVRWADYQHDLINARDKALEEHFGMKASLVQRTIPYEAGEYLGESLDLRFSAHEMASFLVMHLERKAEEARTLASTASDEKIEEMTAALYNGGSHNVKRMLAGLIASLPETQRYMKKVPATRRRLDHSIAIAQSSATRLKDAR
jgi:hypothetical protein